MCRPTETKRENFCLIFHTCNEKIERKNGKKIIKRCFFMFSDENLIKKMTSNKCLSQNISLLCKRYRKLFDETHIKIKYI